MTHVKNVGGRLTVEAPSTAHSGFCTHQGARVRRTIKAFYLACNPDRKVIYVCYF